MQFLNLAALYLFLLSGLIIVFYILKGKRQDIRVPSTMLWKSLIEDYSSPKPRFRLEFDWLLVLQLMIFALLISALAQPQVLISNYQSTKVVLVIDGSASMQANDITPSRFAASVVDAIQRIRNLHPDTEVALVLASAKPEIVQEFTMDHQRIMRTLQELAATDTALDLAATFTQASELLTDAVSGEIWFFTDGSYPGLAYDKPHTLEVFQIGTNTANVGITKLDASMATGRLNEYQVFIEVSNFSDVEQIVPLSISLQGRIIIRDSIELGPEESKAVFYPLNTTGRGNYLVTLHTDDLAVDNTAYLPLGIGEGLRVLLVSPGNFFLERALLTIPNLRLFTKSEVSGQELDLYDLVIFDRLSPPANLSGNTIFIGTYPPELQEGQPLIRGEAQITGWKSHHPLLRFVDLSGLRIRSWYQLHWPPEFETIISGVHGPLLTIYEQPDFRFAVLPFDLYESNLPLQVGFPIFVTNVVTWFYPHVFDANYALVHAGDAYTFPVRRLKMPQSMKNPRGEEISLYWSDHRFVVLDTPSVGFYPITMHDETVDYFAVNLLSKQESDVRPQVFSERFVAARQAEGPFYQDIWPYIVLLGIVLLFLEWYLYHRPRSQKL